MRRELEPLSDHAVVVFGSALTPHFTSRSDIDVAVVSMGRDGEANRALWERLLAVRVPARYDVKVFELLPLPLQMEVVERHEVVFGDRLELSEYFYGFRKLWRDVGPRVRANAIATLAEKREGMARRTMLRRAAGGGGASAGRPGPGARKAI